MTDSFALLEWALVCGLLLSAVLVVIMLVSVRIAPDIWVGDYPPDIRERYGPMSPRAARLRPFIAVPFFVAFFVVPVLGLARLESLVGSVGFLEAFWFAFSALLVFNLVDLLVLDWLIFCTLRPRVVVLPGTQGMAGYRNYRFHFVGFLKGLGFCAFGGLLIAVLWTARGLLP
jgi:hypothetical protein